MDTPIAMSVTPSTKKRSSLFSQATITSPDVTQPPKTVGDFHIDDPVWRFVMETVSSSTYTFRGTIGLLSASRSVLVRGYEQSAALLDLVVEP